MYLFDLKVLLDIIGTKESTKGSTTKTNLPIKVDLTPLQALLDTVMPSLSPRNSGMFQKKAKYSNNVGGNYEYSDE